MAQNVDAPSMAAEIAARLRVMASANTATVRAVRRVHSKRLAKESAQVVREVAFRLLRHSGFPCRWVAYELVAHHRAALQSLMSKDLEQFGNGIASWGAVDTFACYISGPVWRERQVSDRLIHRWARSSD